MGFRTQLLHCLAASLCIVLTCMGTRLQSVGFEDKSGDQRVIPVDSGIAPANGSAPADNVVHLSYAQFHIPFNIDHTGSQPVSVQLYVSTDGGSTWQLHGRSNPTAHHFEFRAAAEGEYLFTVHTLDSAGVAFPSPNAPLRVLVDTTKPQASMQAELDHNGNLIVDLKAFDPHLNTQSGLLRIRTDRDSTWREVAVDQLSPVGDHFEGQVEVILPPCREIVMIFSIMDLAKNSLETSLRYSMPRTAVGQSDMQLASGRSGAHGVMSDNSVPDTAARPGNEAPSSARSLSSATGNTGIVSWDAEAERRIQEASAPPSAHDLSSVTPPKSGISSTQAGNYPTSPLPSIEAASTQTSAVRLGRLTGNRLDVRLGPGPDNSLVDSNSPIEELPLPQPVDLGPVEEFPKLQFDEPAIATSNAQTPNLQTPNQMGDEANPQAQAEGAPLPSDSKESHVTEADVPDSQNPFYSKSRTFSLDYSVEALGGTLLSEVELWGTEDGGATWQKWGTDPDRISPFDVRVGNDGLFGFRMVLVGQGGYVLGQPNSGDTADVWIHVDVEVPICKITRAVYGEGSEAGMLVIDYTCFDSQLPDHPISLSYSSTREGPWSTFASGLRNSGLYLWKVESDVPNRVFLKLEAVDKAGNTGSHRMDLPIDIKGLSPRGRIQGFRPIYEDASSDSVN